MVLFWRLIMTLQNPPPRKFATENMRRPTHDLITAIVYIYIFFFAYRIRLIITFFCTGEITIVIIIIIINHVWRTERTEWESLSHTHTRLICWLKYIHARTNTYIVTVLLLQLYVHTTTLILRRTVYGRDPVVALLV